MTFNWENTDLQRLRQLLIIFNLFFLKEADKVQKWFGEVHHDGTLIDGRLLDTSTRGS